MHEANPILTLLAQLALVLALSRLMGRLISRLHQPQVIGEMAAGIMLGPSLLGWVWPAAYSLVFPPQSVSYLHLLSELGVVFFLFLIGLEFDPQLVRRRRRAAVLVSASSIAAPFVLGVIVTIVLYGRLFDDPTRDKILARSLFMGAAISVTAFPVLARILSERNLHRTEVGAVSIAAAAVNDVLAWCILAFVVAVAQYDPRGGPLRALITVAAAGAYVACMLLVVKPFLRRLQGYYDRSGRITGDLLAVIFLFVLASAFATERIGIHALFGAFLMGCVMPKGSKFVRELSVKLEDFTVVLLLPIFFAYAGLSTDLTRIFRFDLLGVASLIIVLACAGKIGGTALAARACRMPWRESLVVGVLMNTRGLMELIILTIGLSLGVINQTVFAMMVIMALVTTALTTPILHWIYPASRFAADEALAKAAEAQRAYSVLVSVALPESGATLARLAAMLIGTPKMAAPEMAKHAVQPGRLVALHLRRPVEHEAYRAGLDDGSATAPSESQELAPLMGAARNFGQDSKLDVEALSFVTRDVANDICQVAAAKRVDLVLMGFHKPVFGSLLLGGTVHKVLTQCETNVGVFVDRGFASRIMSGDGIAPQPLRILVPYLGSRHDRLAMELGDRIGRNTSARVTVLHVVPTMKGGASVRTQDAKGMMQRVFQDPSQPAPVEFRVIEDDSPVAAVVREARAFDLVIIGVAEEWGLESHLFGWRPERIARDCPTSLMMVRRYATALATEAAGASGSSSVEPGKANPREAEPEPAR